MRKIVLTVIPVFLILFQAVGLAFADDEYDPEELLSIADEEIFIRLGIDQDFSEDQGYVNEILENDTIHEYYVYDGVGTDILMTLFPARYKVMGGNKRLTIPSLWKGNFHISLTMNRIESIPDAAAGNCWIRITNRMPEGSGEENEMIILPGEKASKKTGYSETVLLDLDSLSPDTPIKFDLIRLSGKMYVYADENFLFSFEDEIRRGISFEAGAVLYGMGNRIRCDFDDLSIRYLPGR